MKLWHVHVFHFHLSSRFWLVEAPTARAAYLTVYRTMLDVANSYFIAARWRVQEVVA